VSIRNIGLSDLSLIMLYNPKIVGFCTPLCIGKGPIRHASINMITATNGRCGLELPMLGIMDDCIDR
jgi:hypothetical protein